MIGKSWFDYVQIRISIASLRLIAAVSVGYLAVSAYYGRFIVSPFLGAYAILEACFLLFVYVPRRFILQKAASLPPPLSRAERAALFERCAEHITNDHYPISWFTSTNVRRDNMVEWLLFAMFASNSTNFDPELEEEVNSYLQTVENLTERKLEPGREPNVKSMRVTFDPVMMVHRPLLWYIIVGGLDAWTWLSLAFRGFRHYTPSRWFRVFPPRPLTIFSKTSVDKDLPYWFHPHQSSTKLPIVFLHGIGIGLWPYIPFLKDAITRDPEVGILIIEFLPICSRITDPPLERKAFCKALTRILGSLDIDRFVLFSHSYGTVMAAHIHHSPDLAPRIAATVFVDPIPFLLHLPDVAFNFVYRKPREANEWLLWFFSSRDPDVSRALSRHFIWTENVLWREELQGKCVCVFLSGSDQIVPANAVRKYLTGQDMPELHWSEDGLDVLYQPDLDHATVFDTRGRWDGLLAWALFHCGTRIPLEETGEC